MSASSQRERLPQRQLGELMTELGLISEEQLATVLEVQQQSKRPLGQIIVELGFASGAAVAHALAMQSGGALKTEYGFALGVPPKDEDVDVAAETNGSLPTLRLAPTAVAPPLRPSLEPHEDAIDIEEPAPVAAPPAEPESVDVVAEEIVTDAPVEAIAVEEFADSAPDEVLDGIETIPGTPLADVIDPLELEQLRSEIERLEAALAEAQADAITEQARLQTEAASQLDAAVAETRTEHEQELVRLLEQRDEAAAELEQLRTTLGETQTERSEDHARLQEQHDIATAELERVRTTLAEMQTERNDDLRRLQEDRDEAIAELERVRTALTEAKTERTADHARLQEEHDEVTAELERLETTLAEAESSAADAERRLTDAQERHSAEQDALTAHRDRLQAELDEALQRVSAADAAAEERDRLRAEAEQFESTLAETQTAGAAERERLLGDVERLENALADARAEHEQELARLGAEHERDRAEHDRLQAAVAEAQASAAEQERRLAERQEEHAGERDELIAELEELRRDIERVEATIVEVRERSAAELQSLTEVRDHLTAELDGARELLLQAERVRESQIALEAERDRAMTQLGRLQIVAGETRADLEEQTRLLAEEQDRSHTERETLIAQRTLLEEELGSSIEQLAAAASASDRQERELQLRSERLLEALDAVRGLATELVSGDVVQAGAETDETEPQTDDAPGETEWVELDSESEEIAYSLFVPGPNGYELVPQTGVPPQPGQTVELVLPDGKEPAVYEVVRCGRTLPGGDVCVYLAQV